ncbi:segregation/condensation protein A [Spirochaetia bacterium 38H-sp]|uniref:Segregation and condensation protein A n=1 Tax=Rarispira pelagica TaxID=3141764 RepID=A0ABU9UAM9_9SPIR
MDQKEEEKYNIKTEAFEGPLDLLLFLIKKSEINIYDIPIAEITEQYLEYLKYAEKVDLENITEFYVMAATLIYIKSQMLLPRTTEDLSEDIEDPRKELVDKLIEYQKIKKLTSLMEKQMETEDPLLWFSRKKQQPALPFDNKETTEEMDIWELFQVFSKMISDLSAEKIIDLYEEISTSEKLALMYEKLEDRDEFPFTELITRPDSIMDIICAFLAVLEASKNKIIKIFQNKMFGDIFIRRRENKENTEEDETDT